MGVNFVWLRDLDFWPLKHKKTWKGTASSPRHDDGSTGKRWANQALFPALSRISPGLGAGIPEYGQYLEPQQKEVLQWAIIIYTFYPTFGGGEARH